MVHVCHTHYCQKKLEKIFTLSSELPFLADLIFWLYYIVFAVCLAVPLHQDSKNEYVTQCSPTLKENHIDKNLVNIIGTIWRLELV